jgi:hypothetical protein
MEGGVMAYDYKSPKWQKKRLEILERDQWKCRACLDDESTLHVHHVAYDGQPWEVDDSLMQTLCESCHGVFAEHPKAGLSWSRENGFQVLHVWWCPACACQKFWKISQHYKCDNCNWSTNIYSHVSYKLCETIQVFEAQEKPKNKTYSLKWLTGMMSKVRKGGATDLEIFKVVFPEYAIDAQVRIFACLFKRLQEIEVSDSLSMRDELALCAQLIQARTAIESILDAGEKEVCTLADWPKDFSCVGRALEQSVDGVELELKLRGPDLFDELATIDDTKPQPASDNAIGEWRRASISVGGLVTDFAELATIASWRGDILQVTFPGRVSQVVTFLNRPEVAAALKRALCEVSGREVGYSIAIAKEATDGQ